MAVVTVAVAGATVRRQEQALLSRLAGKVENVAGFASRTTIGACGTIEVTIAVEVTVLVVLWPVSIYVELPRVSADLRGSSGNRDRWLDERATEITC